MSTATAVTDVAARLATKREELAVAERALTDAEQQMDADGVIAASQRIDVLRGFVNRLEADTSAANYETAKASARAWLAEHESRTRASLRRIGTAQEKVRPHLAAVLDAIAREAAARAAFEDEQFGARVLALRFGLPLPARTDAPTVEDWVSPVLDPVDRMRPSRRPRRRLEIGAPANATPQQREALILRAVASLRAQSDHALPTAVRDLLDAAPIPAEVTTKPVREISEHERREMARMAHDVAEATRALSVIPGGFPIAGLG